MFDDMNVALRLSIMCFTVWAWVLTIRFSKAKIVKWSSICLFASVLFLFSPEHIMRILEVPKPDWVAPVMLIGANSLLFTSILLAISGITSAYEKPISVGRVLGVGWGTVFLFFMLGH